MIDRAIRPIAILFGPHFLNRLNVIVFPVPQIDEHFVVSRNLLVRISFGLRWRRRTKENTAAIKRKIQIRAFTDDHLFAETRRRDRNDLSRLGIFAVPMVNTKLWLLRFGVFFVARESKLSVVFVPCESLVFSLAAEQRCWWTVRVGGDCVNAVCFFLTR